MKIERFEDLECWKEARDIVNSVYRVCRVNGFKRDYSLTDQIERAAETLGRKNESLAASSSK